MSSEDEREAVPAAGEDDPLDERTQPVHKKSRPSAEELAAADTTTLGSALPPPVVVEDAEEDETRHVAPPPAERRRPDVEVEASREASSALRPMLFERIQPSLGRGERLRLDSTRPRITLGRAEECDIRLYTASASRQHATISVDAAGQWCLTPAAGRSIEIDGESVDETIVLEVGMNVVLGQDHLRCATEGLDPTAMAARTSDEAFRDADGYRWRGLRGLSERPARMAWAIGLLTALVIIWIFLARAGSGS